MKHLIFLVVLAFSSPIWASGSTFVYNKSRNDVIVSNNPDTVRSIASITKIMTAMVYLDYHRFLNTKVRLITPVRSNLPRQDYSRKDLLAAMLVRSDNAAAETLARDYPGGREAFIEAMNAKARKLGMNNTFFHDPSGLHRGNVSTANELVEMLIAAGGYSLIREATVAKQASFETFHQQKIRVIELPNTNRPLLLEFDSIIISKTGWTTPAGWCVGMVVEKDRQVYVVVVLGSKTKQERFETARRLMINHIPDRQIEELKLDWTF